MCETLFKILEPLWIESVFSQTGIVGNTSETQKLEKRIHNLMDPSQTDELTKRIGVSGYDLCGLIIARYSLLSLLMIM